mmetsp:Transcript_16622/g.37353  ORF Transcript_16622/g.37353 Transcript_16622/m.37353 type:complete len:84 (-) Transcript_16622:606-857(-)
MRVHAFASKKKIRRKGLCMTHHKEISQYIVQIIHEYTTHASKKGFSDSLSSRSLIDGSAHTAWCPSLSPRIIDLCLVLVSALS